MTLITQITDHVQQAYNLLTSLYKNKPKLNGMLEAFTQQVQDAEDAGYDFFTAFNISTAVGNQLDAVGFIVGVSRGGRSDLEYRNAIYTQIAINTSEGTEEDLITIFKLMTGATRVDIVQYYPGQMEIYGNVRIDYDLTGDGADAFAFDGGVDGDGFGDLYDTAEGGTLAALEENDLENLYYTMDAAALGGVRVNYLGYFDDAGFSFDGDPEGGGFGDYYDSTVGGNFATIVENGALFSFASASRRTKGLGTLADSIVGGKFNTV